MRIRNLLILLIPLLFLTGCGPSPTAQLEKNKAVVRQFVEALNARQYDALDELVAPDFVRHCQATPDVQVKSRDEMKQFVQNDVEVFPDGHIRTEILLAEGDLVAGYLTYIGTQTGAMGPYPASGKKVELGYLSIIRIEEGKIAEMWVEWDNIAFFTQLGHFPPPMPEEK
jgi:steroid delta-isomerase-like uncharacterized protein